MLPNSLSSMIVSLSYYFSPILVGLFMYVKWLEGGKINPLSKIFKEDAMELKFTPKVGNYEKFQKKSEKNFLTQFF